MTKSSLKDNFGFLKRIIQFNFIIIFLFIAIFLFRWQFIEVESFQGLAAGRYQRKSLSSIRGDIVARNGETLAYSEPRWDIFAYLGDMKEAESETPTRNKLQTREEFVSKVSNILGNSEDELNIKLNLLSCPIWTEIENRVQDSQIKNDLKNSFVDNRGKFISEASNVLGYPESKVETEIRNCPNWVKIASRVNYSIMDQLETIPRDTFISKIKAKYSVSNELILCVLRESKNDECSKLVNEMNSEELVKLTKFINSNKVGAYLTGINNEFTSQRIYPEETLASHVVGFLGRDLNSNDIGRGGVEQKYNGVLEPQEGFIAGETDSQGNLITISESVSIRAKRGSTVKLTIDKKLQEIVERKIKEGVEKYQADSGSVVIIDPKTGEILALANYPNFDPNNYFNVNNVADFTNKAVSIPYEVGSVAKVFTISAAVEELDVQGDQIIINGHDGCTKISASTDEYDIREICTFDKMPQGPLTATEALIKSDNLAFAELGKSLGKENLHKYLVNFGMGKSSGIDLSGESIGLLPELDDPYAWHPVDVAVFSYGHGYQSNLIQITKGIAAVANNGWLMQPYVVSEIIDANGSINKFEPISVEKVVSSDTTNRVKVMMEELYKRNAAEGYSHLYNYKIAAKSGTALIPYKDKPGYSDEVNATYIGFDASENSKFIMAVKLEAPKAVQKLSFYSVRPLWLDIFNEIRFNFGLNSEE